MWANRFSHEEDDSYDFETAVMVKRAYKYPSFLSADTTSSEQEDVIQLYCAEILNGLEGILAHQDPFA